MNWTHLEDENGYRCLSIEAPWDEIAADYHDLVARYTAAVRLPGFRPGKTPQGAIEQRFRKELLADLSALTVRRLGREAVRGAGVEALGPLEASEIECDKGKLFRARVRYIPMPEIALPELADLVTAEDGSDPRDLISRRLLELVPFELPPELVRQEIERDGLGENTPDSETWTAAAERIRLMVILKRIARQEGIEVDERDVTRRIAEKAREFETTEKELQADIEEGDGMARLQDMLLAESTLAYLMEVNRW
jgi:FKBP-type peptidyl-prolyl cis-trans isomerase (trigger factor)